MKSTIEQYLAARGKEKTDVRPAALTAMGQLSACGVDIDALLVRVEHLMAAETSERQGVIEELRQTLAGLSREAWAAHESSRRVSVGWLQLQSAEGRLREWLASQ
jgi:hypothetical protein